MKPAILAACVVLGLGACGGGGGDLKSQMQGFKDRTCACPDKACVRKVETDYQAWRADAKQKMAESKPDDKTLADLNEIENAMEGCSKKFDE